MDKKQYNNIIDWTQQNQPETQTEDSLTAVRAVCDNMGVALPQGDLAQVAETLATDDYMYWHSCTQQEAQEAADKGIPTIGISEDSIVLLAATDEEQPVTTTTTVMTLENNENNNVSNMAYYSYSCCTTCVEDDSGSDIEEIQIISWNNIMYVDEHRNFQVLVKPEKPAGLRLVWNSSDSSVIAITDAGEAWARKVGKTRLSVKTADGKHQDAIDVEVVVDYVTIQKDGNYSKVVFRNGMIWKCDSFHYDNVLKQNVPDHYDRANYNASIDFSVKQLGFLFRIDPNGVTHYVSNKQLSGDTTPTDYLLYRDDIFKEIYGEEPRYFNYENDKLYYYDGINKNNRYNVYSEAELIFGILPRWTLQNVTKVLLGFALDIISIYVPALGYGLLTLDLVTAFYHTGAFAGPINDAATDYLGNVVESYYQEKAARQFGWAMTIVNLIPSLLESALPPDVDSAQIAIYESTYQNNSYAIIIADSNQTVNLSEFIEHYKKLLPK